MGMSVCVGPRLCTCAYVFANMSVQECARLNMRLYRRLGGVGQCACAMYVHDIDVCRYMTHVCECMDTMHGSECGSFVCASMTCAIVLYVLVLYFCVSRQLLI